MAISSTGSSKQVVRTLRILDSLFPEVFNELMYSSRADFGTGVNGFLEGPAWIWVVLIWWRQGEDDEGGDDLEGLEE